MAFVSRLPYSRVRKGSFMDQSPVSPSQFCDTFAESSIGGVEKMFLLRADRYHAGWNGMVAIEKMNFKA